ncbi:hypothetical protein ZWY2020_048323 [Hordeum vulgare]|nr:hypothetical protein ZWY2020_048323 [Hordeum vulgare]
MSEPFQNWLGMGATIPARIQPGSIDHVPFPTVVSCLGASFFGFTMKPDARLSHYHLPPFFPPIPSRMKIAVCMFDFGFTGQTKTLLQEDLCFAHPPPPDIPIERKSCW